VVPPSAESFKGDAIQSSRLRHHRLRGRHLDVVGQLEFAIEHRDRKHLAKGRLDPGEF
jgi:hypothetical protein